MWSKIRFTRKCLLHNTLVDEVYRKAPVCSVFADVMISEELHHENVIKEVRKEDEDTFF